MRRDQAKSLMIPEGMNISRGLLEATGVEEVFPYGATVGILEEDMGGCLHCILAEGTWES